MAALPRFYRNDKWNNACRQFILSVPNPETQHTYAGVLTRFIDYLKATKGSRCTPDKATSEDVEHFLHRPAQNGRSAGGQRSAYSINTYLNALRAFYSYCAKQKTMFRGKWRPLIPQAKIPTNGVRLEKTEDVSRDMTEDELRAFFAAIDRKTLRGKRDFALFWALLVTGRRRREITHLRKGDVEETTFADGRRGWRFHFRSKKRAQKEHAELPRSVVDALIDFHAAAGRDFLTMPADTPLFPATKGRMNDPIALNYVDILFRGYAVKAGMPSNVVTHSFRWENAWQRFQANGKDILAVQEDLGWKHSDQAIHYIRRRRRIMRGDPVADAIAAKFAF